MSKEAHVSASRRRPTQADIARVVGVSQATVSIVLQDAPNARSRILPETRDRILAVAGELGYSPNAAARSLVGGRNYLLGFHTFEQVFPSDQRDFYFPFLLGVERAATAQGYDLLLFSSLPEARRDGMKTTNRLMMADGCILLGRHVDRDVMSELARMDFPVVFIGRREIPNGDIAYVGINYQKATKDLVDHLVGLGHRTLGYVGEPGGGEQSQDRLRGYLDGVAAMGEYGPDCRKHSKPLTTEELRRWIDAGVTAILVEPGENDANVRALEAAAEELGVSIPDDLSVAVVGDPDFTTVNRSDWTKFTIESDVIAHLAVDLLVGILDGTPVDRHVLIDSEIVGGGTSAAPRSVTSS